LRFPDGTLCNPQDEAACLRADQSTNKLLVVDHSTPHTWSLTSHGQLQLDHTTKCVSMRANWTPYLADCASANFTFMFADKQYFEPLSIPADLQTTHDQQITSRPPTHATSTPTTRAPTVPPVLKTSVSIYNYSTLNPDNGFVYIYGDLAASCNRPAPLYWCVDPRRWLMFTTFQRSRSSRPKFKSNASSTTRLTLLLPIKRDTSGACFRQLVSFVICPSSRTYHKHTRQD
jgi:hypothetical protein